MNPPSSDSAPDQTEAALESGQLPPPGERTTEFQRQQTVEETLRGLASLLAPDPGPEITTSWQRAVHPPSPLTDQEAAAAEAVLAGRATGPDRELWQKWQEGHPQAATATQKLDRALGRLPEAAGLPVPPPVLETFRRTLSGGTTSPKPKPSLQSSWLVRIRQHPLLATASAGAVTALAILALPLVFESRLPKPEPEVSPEASLLLSGPVPPTNPPFVTTLPPRLTDDVEAPGTLGPGVTGTLDRVAAKQAEPAPLAPPPGSMEVLRPKLLAQLTGGPALTQGPAGATRSGNGGPVIGTELKLLFRRAGSTELTDSPDERMPALAAALTDPLLADEPYFLVDDHSSNDLDVSLRRATVVCTLLTNLGVPAQRLRAGGKGRFELRPGPDGQSSLVTIRPASARARRAN